MSITPQTPTIGPSKWSLHGFYESTTNNGLLPVAALTDPLLPRNSGDNLVFNESGIIRHCHLVTAAIANTDQWRWKKPADPLYKHFAERVGVRDQTDDVERERIIDCAFPISPSSVLNVDVDNTNNAQVECALFWLDYGFGGPLLGYRGPNVDQDILFLNVTGATTVTAGAWTLCSLTWPALDPDTLYQIVGLAIASASGYAGRMLFGDTKYRPGVIACDPADRNVMLWADFGTFKGQNEPNIEMLCSAGDTAQTLTVAVLEVG